MGSPATPARNRLARRLPAIAAPVLCGAAAAFAVAATPATSTAATTQAQGHHAAVTSQRPAATARLTSVTRPVANTAAAVSYTVNSGDTLSAIAQRYYSNPSFWTVLFAANQGEIANPNVIQVGQVLTIPATPASAPAAPSGLSAASAPAPVQQSAPQQSAPQQSAPPQSASVETAPVQQSTVSTAGDSSFQQCVISRESGGNPQALNSSDHYGLYQFSASTWAEYGGNPGDFGHASVGEQNQVFNNAIAAGGQSNWAPYDGC
ncbi:MAG TPA: LysM peptidoglycan-binding domain-containing protein [Trebonia sp.]